MSTDATAASPAATNLLARFTFRVFGLFPISLTMLVLRVTLALPFWKSGLTKWDGWFTMSFGAKALFADEFKLHLFGAEYPYPAPELVAYVSAIGEVALPVLLVLGLGAVRRVGAVRHDRDHPIDRPGRLDEFPPAVGRGGTGDLDVRAGEDRAGLSAGTGSCSTARVSGGA
ncbi:MAG TPA: DoxX family membrane protein [Roseiarcus sp.]